MKNLNNGYTLVKSIGSDLVVVKNEAMETIKMAYVDVLEYAPTNIVANQEGTLLVETSLVEYAGDDEKVYYTISNYESDIFKGLDFEKQLDFFVNNPTYSTIHMETMAIFTNLKQATNFYKEYCNKNVIDVKTELFKLQSDWKKAVYIIDGIYENSKDDAVNVLDSFSEKNTDHLYNWIEGIYNTLTKEDSKIFTESEIVSFVLDEMVNDEKESYKIKESNYFENEEEAEKDGYFWNESLDKWIKLDFNTYLQ